VEVDGWEVPDVFTSVAAECAAAHGGVVVYDSSPLGRLRLTGTTRVDFLHRMSTNDMNSLTAGQGAATIFTTPLARIVDRALVYLRADDLLMLTSRGAQAKVVHWLRKYIFFNDDVQVRDVSSEFGMLSIYGVKASEAASQVAGENVGDLSLHAWRLVAANVLVARADAIGGDGFHLIAAPDELAALWPAAIEAGAVPIGEQAFEVLRIESGQPRYAHELSETYIPLEVGLWQDVSFSKGCYIGQEIIARMESRQRLAKQIVGLRAREPIQAGSDVYMDGSSVGKVTSAAARPDGTSIGIGFVKPAHASAGTRVSLDAARSADVDVTAFPIP
jgi:aminomethyltransferase